ncbi:MAG: DUF1854 domain-containing protein, partial [Armatimonadota bacterium]|nr:DUF1854 domain-containing protein [Armatimonadota bacterium]
MRRGEDGALRMTLDGQSITLGPPRRTLPLSEPDRFIVLSDSEGRELGLIGDIAELEPASRAVLEKALAEVYV